MDVDSEELIAGLEAMLEHTAGTRVPVPPPAVPLEEWAQRHGLGR